MKTSDQRHNSTNCIICGSQEVQFLVRTRDRHYGIPNEFDVVVCQGCGLRQLDPLPSESELLSFYGPDYYAFVPPSRAPWWKSIARRILRSRIPTHNPSFAIPGDFLDIGCGAGDYLLIMRDRGWRVCGAEPVQAGVKAGREAGFDIRHGSLLEAGFEDASFDYVRSNHSFEHIVNPLEILHEIRRILRPDGKLFLGIPNADSLPARIFGRYWWYMGVPLHPFTYSPSTLTSLVTKAGLRVEQVYYNSNYSSVTGSLQIYLNRNNGKTAGEGLVLNNIFLRLAGNAVARTFDLLHQGDAIELICSRAK